MKNLKTIIAATFLAALLTGSILAQQQGAQTLSTTTLGSAVSTTNGTSVNLASLTNVTATAAVQTTLWVDTEAMDVVTNGVPSSGTVVQVTRGARGTKAQTHPSGRTVYVSRPNLFQNYDVAGSCTANSGLAAVLPWINVSSGNRFECYSDGIWFNSGHGSQATASRAIAPGFCTGTVGTAETEFLNGAACSGATTSTYRYTSPVAGELANLRVFSSAAVTGGASKDVLTVFKNGAATAITCTIAAAGTTCSDATHAVAVAPGDTITFQFVTATSDTAANISASAAIYGQ